MSAIKRRKKICLRRKRKSPAPKAKFLSIPHASHTVAHTQCRCRGKQKQHHDAIAKQYPRHQPPQIGAFIGSQPLDASICHKRQQKQHQYPRRRRRHQEKNGNPCQNTNHLTCTAGTDGELFPMKKEGAVSPAVAAKYTRQPSFQPLQHVLFLLITSLPRQCQWQIPKCNKSHR